MKPNDSNLPFCFRKPVPEIAEAAGYLDQAASALLDKRLDEAAKLIDRANRLTAIRKWTESLWGKKSPYLNILDVANLEPVRPKNERVKVRMPNLAEKRELFDRDGFHCRFCGIPVIRLEVRNYLKGIFKTELPWGRSNPTQHAAFQAMWVHYDHLRPHSRGGNNALENTVISCAPCNCARMRFTLAQVGLNNPLNRPPVRSMWDGLERVLQPSRRILSKQTIKTE